MRSTLAALLVLATVACGSFGPAAYADPPPMDGSDPEVAAVAVAVTPRVELVDDEMRPLPTFAQGGRRFVLGAIGTRYRLRVVNPTPGRVEAVIAVDGLDVIDGRPASLGKRGYLLEPYGEVTIDGWRTSLDTVAAFRFSSVRASYAARTKRDRNVGVIGVAFFRERAPVVPIAPPAPPPQASRAAPSPRSAAAGASPADASEERPGLGTEYGEVHESHVTEEAFYRASGRPDAVFELRYDDAEGLAARGIPVRARDPRGEENARRDRAQAFPGSRFAQPPP